MDDSNINIQETNYGDKFGYSEMFEWTKLPNNGINHLGKFVQFNKEHPSTIELSKTNKNILGVTAISPGYIASNPEEWPYRYLFNEYGDLFLEQQDIGVGKRKYDAINEMAYIETSKKTIYVPIVNPGYDDTKEYVKRSSRKEWEKVVILGKAIVEDNGKCVPGEYCTCYTGDNKSMFGIAVPYDNIMNCSKYFVLERLSEHTILIFITPKI